MCVRSHCGSNRLPQEVLNQIAFVTRQGCSIRMAGTTGAKRQQVRIQFQKVRHTFYVPASRFEVAQADARQWKDTVINDTWSQQAFGFKIADLEWKYIDHSAEEDSREPELLQSSFSGAQYKIRCPASRACEIQLCIEHLQRATDAEGLQPPEIRARWATITALVRPTCTCSGCADSTKINRSCARPSSKDARRDTQNLCVPCKRAAVEMVARLHGMEIYIPSPAQCACVSKLLAPRAKVDLRFSNVKTAEDLRCDDRRMNFYSVPCLWNNTRGWPLRLARPIRSLESISSFVLALLSIGVGGALIHF